MSVDTNSLEDINSPNSIPDTPEIDTDDVLLLQTRKAELVQERDSLAQRRAELKQSIERLSVSLSRHKKQQLQYETKQKLEYYLHQNDHECTKLTRPDEAASFVLKNLNVLPTTDVSLRMQLIDRFYPSISVTRDSVSTIHKDDVLFTVISFQVSADSLPPLDIRLLVKDDTVHEVELLQFSEVAHIFQKISPSFCAALTQNYSRLRKIDLIMYSYHSLAQLQHIRIATFTQILQKYSTLISRPVSWDSDPNLSLMSASYIELTITEKSRNEIFKVRLRWDLVLENTASGEAGTQLNLSVLREGFGPLKDVNGVFLTLVQENGVIDALSLMLRNLFDV